MPLELGTLKVFTVEELAKKLKVNPRTIYEYIKSGKLAATRFGKQYRITQEGLDACFNPPANGASRE